MTSDVSSHVSEDTLDLDVDSSPLSQSLLAISNHPDCPSSPGYFEGIPTNNQPRRLASMPDAADYFVRGTKQPLSMVFPAQIDLRGNYSRLLPYFNLPETVMNLPHLYFLILSLPLAIQIELKDLRKCRAQFELRLLNDDIYPELAIRASSSAYETCVVFFNEVHTQRNGSK